MSIISNDYKPDHVFKLGGVNNVGIHSIFVVWECKMLVVYVYVGTDAVLQCYIMACRWTRY